MEKFDLLSVTDMSHPDDEAGDDSDDGGEGEGVGPQTAHARPRPLHLFLVTATELRNETNIINANQLQFLEWRVEVHCGASPQSQCFVFEVPVTSWAAH